MTKICKNCKYYTPPKDEFNIKIDHGNCSNEKIFYDEEDKRPLNDKLEYWDYESYSAGFAVGKNFGCIHFKKK